MSTGHCEFGVGRVRQAVIAGRFVLVSGSYLDTLVDIGVDRHRVHRFVDIALTATERLAQNLVGSVIERTVLLPIASVVTKCCKAHHTDRQCPSYRR
jgi:hypothetical protein